ncbi:PQQ-binding-like beta-propeller repeat protein [Streptomyces sp. TLI_146]|uniref:caspase, EACC1-associated type n=1 Tax=Streptomyces sp. TLI_146 TaxID=1938858 RepID=UPI000C71590E|nr:PQQ-binding-like beta-propeller repeat protein [Streptomyces sp. TLI_146]PKV89167.1 outer membrane protein assembly factor BamB [Streptomyces sp. TLI_146]
MGRRLALLVATYEYQDAGLRSLTAPAHDAEALAGVLRDPDIAGFEVTTLINEPHYRVGEAIGDLFRDRRRDDLTLLYFTGHGLKDDEGHLHLAMGNTRRDNLAFTSLPAEQIDRAMTGCASRQQVLILDCCYSGAFPAGRLAKGDADMHTLERFRGRGRSVLTASDATQYSFEGDQVHGLAQQSVFTRHLVSGLRDGSADLDGDGDITLDELYAYVHDKVVEEMPQQRPKKQENVEGRIVIARNVNWQLPAHVRHALASPLAADRLGAIEGLADRHRIGNATVRQRVEEEMRRLLDDDSRSVSAAAERRLRTLAGAGEDPTSPTPVPPPQATAPALASAFPPEPQAPPAPSPAPDRVRWSAPTEASVHASLAVVNGSVHVGDNRGRVYAVEKATGRDRWCFDAGNPVHAVLAGPEGTVGVTAGPYFHLLDARTGAERWQFRVRQRVTALPETDGGSVYLANSNSLYALSLATGERSWTYCPRIAPFQWVAAAGGLVWTATARAVYGVNAATGKRKWRTAVPSPVSSRSALSEWFLYVGSGSGGLYAIDALTGQIRWRTSVGSGVSVAPVLADGLVCVCTDAGPVCGIDAVTGESRWVSAERIPTQSPPAVAGGTVYVGSADGHLYALSAETGALRWRLPTARPIQASPTVSDGVVYVADLGGRLYAVEHHGGM